eukprot:7110729-Prymnesium_polylepis.1
MAAAAMPWETWPRAHVIGCSEMRTGSLAAWRGGRCAVGYRAGPKGPRGFTGGRSPSAHFGMASRVKGDFCSARERALDCLCPKANGTAVRSQ